MDYWALRKLEKLCVSRKQESAKCTEANWVKIGVVCDRVPAEDIGQFKNKFLNTKRERCCGFWRKDGVCNGVT